jgi:hypothetical protein
VHRFDGVVTPQAAPPVAVVTQVNPNITVQANANSPGEGVAAFVAGIVVGIALAFAIDQASDNHDGSRK